MRTVQHMRSKRTIRVWIGLLAASAALLTPVRAEAAVPWAYYEGTARWENHVSNGSFNIVLYPLGHHDDKVLNSYRLSGDVRVPSAWCTGDGDIAWIQKDSTAGYSFDAVNETYGGPLTDTIHWECRNGSNSGNAPFKFDFSIAPDEPSDPGPCLSPWDDVFQVCDERRARVGSASFCWASGIGCASPVTTILPGKLFAARVFKAAGTAL